MGRDAGRETEDGEVASNPRRLTGREGALQRKGRERVRRHGGFKSTERGIAGAKVEKFFAYVSRNPYF